MRRQLLPALTMTIVLTVLLGLVYPLAVTGVSQLVFGSRADGSLVRADGRIIGSSLIGQTFTDQDGNPDPRYFQPRPSAAGTGYDAMSSGGSNLGPSNPKLIAPASGPDCFLVDSTDAQGAVVTDTGGKPVRECSSDTVPGRVAAYRAFNQLSDDATVPVDAVTTSASGLDPDISVANARLQAPRVARQRNLAVDRVMALVDAHTNQRPFGFLGEQTVNVLDLNLALDSLH